MTCCYNSNFQEDYAEIGGYEIEDLPPIRPGRIPRAYYVPVVEHQSSRSTPLKYPIVAIPLSKIFRLSRKRNKDIELSVQSADHLREKFMLSRSTRVLIRAIGKDEPLEKFWEYRLSDNFLEQLSALELSGFIGPNFSFFLDAPRTTDLHNRKRQAITLCELDRHSIPAIPHLSARTEADWDFWLDYLQRNEGVATVAKEFETGNKNRQEAEKQIVQLARMQDRLGRPLRVIGVGGAQFLPLLARHFRAVTIMDSNPFHKALRRRLFTWPKTSSAGWEKQLTLKGQPIDQIFQQNVSRYSGYIQARLELDAFNN